MQRAVTYRPERVHTGLVKLWPASTGRDDWMWSHRGGHIGQPVATQHEPNPIIYFSLGFLWVPRRLLSLAFPRHEDWRWGEMDVQLSELAYHNQIPVSSVAGCTPKHLHFTEAHNR